MTRKLSQQHPGSGDAISEILRRAQVWLAQRQLGAGSGDAISEILRRAIAIVSNMGWIRFRRRDFRNLEAESPNAIIFPKIRFRRRDFRNLEAARRCRGKPFAAAKVQATRFQKS